jgi:hypothetical protein
MTMTKFLIGAAALAMLSANPASAQLLGGGGGGGGMLGGGLGGIGGGAGGALGGVGSLGGSMGGIGRLPDTAIDTAGRTSSSGRVDKSVNHRNGRVSASGSGSTDSAIANTTSIAGRSISGSGATSASGSGGTDAQLIGTDNVRGIADQTVGATRGAVQQTGDTAKSAASSAQGYTSSASGSAAGTGSGALSGGTGMLALAGSAAGSGTGAFNVMPGMNVTDAKGHIIGKVHDLKSTSTGQVRDVVMTVGNRTATLPASNFSGSGNALVSVMGKGDITSAAKDQAAK